MTDFIVNLYQIVEKNSNKKALIDYNGKFITYGEFKDKLDYLCYYLKSAGIKKMSKILILCPLNIELYILILSLFKIQACVVFIDPWAGKKYIDNCLKIIQPEYLILNKKAYLLLIFSKMLRRIPKRFKLPKILKKSIKNNKKDNDISKIDYENNALITFTTGSTSNPKALIRTHRHLILQHQANRKYLKHNDDIIELTYFPIFILSNLISGITTVLPKINIRNLNKVNSKKIIYQINKYNVSSIKCSTSYIQKILEYCIKNNISLKLITKMIIAGGPAKANLFINANKVTKYSDSIFLYGCTEAEPISLINFQEILKDKIYKYIDGNGFPLGKPVKDINCKIVDFNTANHNSFVELKPNQPGEIIVSGEYVGKNYYNNKEAFEQTKIIHNNIIWHRTFDIGYKDHQGLLWFLGRKNSILKQYNKTFFQMNIEPCIDQLYFVKKSSVFQSNKNKIRLLVSLNLKNYFLLPVYKKKFLGLIKEVLNKKRIITDKIIFTTFIPLDQRHKTKIDYKKVMKKYGD